MGRKSIDISGEKNPNYKTGMTLSVRARRGIYNTWQNMKQRCLNPLHPKFKRYGGRGINICKEWISIQGFKKWAESSGFLEGMTIDRKDNNKGYFPENCHWVSAHQNARKKSTTKISYSEAKKIRNRLAKGESESKLAEEYEVVQGTIWFISRKYTHVPDGECSKMLKNRARQ